MSCDRRTCVILVIIGIVLTILSVGAVLGVIYLVNNEIVKIPYPSWFSRPYFYPVDCIPEGNPTLEKCRARGCDWSSGSTTGSPLCSFPNSHGSYQIKENPVFNRGGGNVRLIRISNASTLFGGDVNEIELRVSYISRQTVRLKFFDPNIQRHEMPLDIEPGIETDLFNKSYEVIVDDKDTTGVIVRRQPDGEANMWAKPGQYELPIVFDSRHPCFVFSDQFLQLSTRLPGWRVYGVGDGGVQLTQDIQWRSWGLWARELLSGQSLGVHPFIMVVDPEGRASGIFLRSSHAMEMVFQPKPAVVFRTTGGILDFYIFLGPSPEEVIQQYTKIVGRSTIPPYWALGMQYGRERMNETFLRESFLRMNQSKLPFDVVHLGSQVLQNFNGFTYDVTRFTRLPELVQKLRKEQGKRVVISTSAGFAMNFSTDYLPVIEATARNLLIGGSKPLVGKLAQGLVVYPDYFHSDAQNYWAKISGDFHTEIEFDAIYLDSNYPANLLDGSITGCAINKFNRPPYFPKNTRTLHPAYYRTICLDAKHASSAHRVSELHYNLHNLYGRQQAKVAYNGLIREFRRRPWVITTSHASGTSSFASHFITGTRNTWDDMKKSLLAVLQMNILGYPAVGSDICGSHGNSSIELCRRWIQLGAFYPIARIYKSGDDQDQVLPALGEKPLPAAREAFNRRYELLPYLYTLFYLASTDGSTVARPVFHEFRTDNVTWAIEDQFMWGGALLISPVLTPPGSQVPDVYLPEGRWFDYYTGMEVNLSPGFRKIPRKSDDQTSLHIRGGYVIPIHSEVNWTTVNTKPLHLIVALDEHNSSIGTLYIDDSNIIIRDPLKPQGTQFRFTFRKDIFRWSFVTNAFQNTADLYVECVRFLGVSGELSALMVDGRVWTSYDYLRFQKILRVNQLKFKLHDREHSIQLMFRPF